MEIVEATKLKGKEQKALVERIVRKIVYKNLSIYKNINQKEIKRQKKKRKDLFFTFFFTQSNADNNQPKQYELSQTEMMKQIEILEIYLNMFTNH